MFARTQSVLLALAVPALTIALPAQITGGAGGSNGSRNQQKGPLFVDFSEDLNRPRVVVVIGTMDKIKEGRRQKLKDKEAHLGSGNAVSRVAGTQFFKVAARSKVKVGVCLAGKHPGRSVALAFDMQLARLPDGSYRRQMMQSTRTELKPGMAAMWVLGKGKKKGYRVLHVIEQPRKGRGDKPPSRAFEEDMRDFVGINQRIAGLKQALEVARQKRAKDPKAAVQILEKALGRRLELENETNDRLLGMHVRPWERRARKLLDALSRDGAGKASSRPTSRRKKTR